MGGGGAALVALALRHDVLQPLQQHVRAAAAALGTGPLTGGGGGRGHGVPLRREDPLPAHAALLDEPVDGRQLLTAQRANGDVPVGRASALTTVTTHLHQVCVCV